jgi:hypothetical protein
MGKLKVHAGDFVSISPNNSFSRGFLNQGTFHLATEALTWKLINTEAIGVAELDLLSIADEENVKKLGGTIGWGAAGGLLLGPVGLLAGLLLGGKKKEVTFVAKFKDGRKLIATTDSKTWVGIQAGAIHLI